MTFLAVVSSPLPSFHVVYPVFFLNSATQNILGWVSPPWRVSCTRGGPPLLRPLVTPLTLNCSIAAALIEGGVKRVLATLWILLKVNKITRNQNYNWSPRHWLPARQLCRLYEAATFRMCHSVCVVCLFSSAQIRRKTIWIRNWGNLGKCGLCYGQR